MTLARQGEGQPSGHTKGRVDRLSGQTVRYSVSLYCIITGLIDVF